MRFVGGLLVGVLVGAALMIWFYAHGGNIIVAGVPWGPEYPDSTMADNSARSAAFNTSQPATYFDPADFANSFVSGQSSPTFTGAKSPTSAYSPSQMASPGDGTEPTDTSSISGSRSGRFFGSGELLIIKWPLKPFP